MAQYSYNDSSFDVRTASLIERLNSFFDEVKIWPQEQGYDQPMPLLQFRALLLIAEIYEHVRKYVNNHEIGLSDYFGEWTLKRCLELVVAIEGLQKHLNEIRPEIEYLIALSDHHSDVVGEANLPMGHSELRVLYECGIDGFWGDETNAERPTIFQSLLWNANSADEHHYRFGRLFQKAKEQLDENNEGRMSPDPNDQAYNKARHQSGLSHQIAFKAKLIETHEDQNGFNFLQYILNMQRESEDASAETICFEMDKALEMLRNVYMAEAEDIYYIRTGDFSELVKIYDKSAIKHLYTDLPFKKYYQEKKMFVSQLLDDMEVDLANWRCRKDYIGRKLSKEEHKEFLQERMNNVVKNMKSYKDLWELRKHSGGLDTVVTPENFARMFYRRRGVDRYFIELQWELEELTSLIEKNKQKSTEKEPKTMQTPEQKAVADFVDKIIILANEVYKEWNNKRVVPAVHGKEILIVIQRNELIKHIQDKMKNNFDELLELCYPETSKSKQVFCQYVVQLQNDGYFGSLPNKFLAEILAPIVKLSPGTTTNYLSK